MIGILVGRGTADLFADAFYAMWSVVAKALTWLRRKVFPSDVQ